MINVANIFAKIKTAAGEEQFHTLPETCSVKIERIVSEAHQSPAGFWYDQAETEWVILLRGEATLEFDGGHVIDLTAGDHLTIPRHVKHRINRTAPETIWLAVRLSE